MSSSMNNWQVKGGGGARNSSRGCQVVGYK